MAASAYPPNLREWHSACSDLLAMNHGAVIPPSTAERPRSTATHGYCAHEGARHVRLYMPYADANTLRLRVAQAPDLWNSHVSSLYQVPGGWGWTICRECRARERRSA